MWKRNKLRKELLVINPILSGLRMMDQIVMTDPFPASVATATDPGGDAKIEAKLVLPQPCIAPLVFVTSPGGAWFATTGK